MRYTNKPSDKRIFYLVCGLLMAVSEVWKQYTLTFILGHGHYNWWYFPFQLCSIPMYLCLLIPWIHSDRLRRTCLTFLADFGLLGGIFAFFDTSGMQYDLLSLTVHSYLWHILLIFIGLYTGFSGRDRSRFSSKRQLIFSDRSDTPDFSFRGYLHTTGLYLVCCLVATGCNYLFHPFGKINMFYISPHYWMNQVVFRNITHSFGNPAGILSYIAVTIIGAGILHGIWSFIHK